jgi:hypothetical protein
MFSAIGADLASASEADGPLEETVKENTVRNSSQEKRAVRNDGVCVGIIFDTEWKSLQTKYGRDAYLSCGEIKRKISCWHARQDIACSVLPGISVELFSE